MDNVLIEPVGPDASIGPANALRRCLLGIGCSGNKPTFFYRVTPVINNGYQFAHMMIFAGEVGNDLIKKRLVLETLVMFPGDGAGGFRNVNTDHLQAGVPEFGQNTPNELFADAVGLDDNKSGFAHHLILAIMRSRSSNE